MASPLKVEKGQMLVDCYAMEVYLPADYADSAYRGTPFYARIGSKVKFLAVGNMRFFKSEKELEDPESVTCYPLGIPMIVTSEPSGTDIQEIRFSKGGRIRKCIVLIYMKGEPFLISTETIKNTEAMMMVLARLEQGKLDHLPPEVVVQLISDCERMNNLSLRIPSEDLEIFVAERYRDPDYPTRKYRYHTGKVDPDIMISHNMRTDAMQSTTYQGITHEDISTALIAAVNRKEAGIVDEPTLMERVTRGLSMEDLKEADQNMELIQTMDPPVLESEKNKKTKK